MKSVTSRLSFEKSSLSQLMITKWLKFVHWTVPSRQWGGTKFHKKMPVKSSFFFILFRTCLSKTRAVSFFQSINEMTVKNNFGFAEPCYKSLYRLMWIDSLRHYVYFVTISWNLNAQSILNSSAIIRFTNFIFCLSHQLRGIRNFIFFWCICSSI